MSEAEIKRAICDWLAAHGCLFWLHITQRMNRKTKYLPTGIADIIGIWRGRPLAIEVKTEKGAVSVEQAKFLAEFARQGGIAIIARNVEDVAKVLA